MTIEIINPWTGQVDYRYDYIGEDAVEETLARSQDEF